MPVKNRSIVATMLMLSLLTAAVCASFAQPEAKKGAVATVAGRPIESSVYESRLTAAREQITRRGGQRPAEFDQLLRRQVLESLIRIDLLEREAERLRLVVTPAEAESALQRDPFFSPQGRFDAERWRVMRLSQPERFAKAVSTSATQLKARRLEARMREQFQPDEDLVRGQASRYLRRAFTEDLSLPVAEFSGEYPEPRETDVLRYYQEHQESYRESIRAMLSVVFVNDPPLTPQEQLDPARSAAWSKRMRQAADSLLLAVRAGQSFERVSVRFGGPRSDVTVVPGNFPGYWRGDESVNERLFRMNAGEFLEAPVPSSDGWLVVRVDRVTPSSIKPLRSVSRQIRTRLREESRAYHVEREARALYEAKKDSLRQMGWAIRYAVLDTSRMATSRPSEADIERWYRGHLAEFYSFDETRTSMEAKPLDAVRAEVIVRWQRDARMAAAREQAETLRRSWEGGRRAPAVERLCLVKELPATLKGAPVDTGVAAAALSRALWANEIPPTSGVATYPRGLVVWKVIAQINDFIPPFDQMRPRVLQVLADRELQRTLIGARQLYENDPSRFRGGKVLHFSRLIVPMPEMLSVRLTRAQVEQFHLKNLANYSAPELVRARHILISPASATSSADRAARSRADSLLALIRAGESFSALAERFSDDPATQKKGGDLGVFARGAMLPEFEAAAFAMKAGDLQGPVKTEAGYHLIECTEHVAPYAQPLSLIYAIVASDLAKQQVDTLARLRADSLLRRIEKPSDAQRVAQQMGWDVVPFSHPIDAPMPNTQLIDYFAQLAKMKPGQVMRPARQSRGEGYWITWLDSLTTASNPSWDEIREQAVAAYRAGSGERALVAKMAEMDSLERQGVSLDSLSILWGGLNRSKELAPPGVTAATDIPGSVDSLVFGREGAPAALQVGESSGWVRWPSGVARVRLVERKEPPLDRLHAREIELRRIKVEARLAAWYEDLKRRYPVVIADPELRAIPLPELPPEN